MAKFRNGKFLLLCVFVLCLCAGMGISVLAEEKEDVMVSGVCIDGMDVSGMTEDEIKAAVWEHVNALSGSSVTFIVGENSVQVPVSQLGFGADVDHIYDEAAGLCKKGNIVKRYKDMKQLQTEGMNYKLKYTFDETAVRKAIEEKCKTFDQVAVNAGLKKAENGFEITEGVVGYELDIEESVKKTLDYLESEWNSENTVIALAVQETQPKGSKDELSKVTDLLATATTSYASSGKNRCGNVERAASLINGMVLYPGDELSVYKLISPITVENGYFEASAYSNGEVVESAGGGVCQVSTTLYNAVLKAELEVTERFNHSMIVSYVKPAMDAAIAGTYKDLKFKNNTDAPIYVEGITAQKKVTFNIYGMETRPANREVEFVSEVIEEKEPTVEIKTSKDLELGKVNKQSAHTGYVSKLWKIVKEDGQEISRTEVNSSKYAMSPIRYTVGTAKAKPEALKEIEAAIKTKDIDKVKAIVGKYAKVEDKTQDSEAADAAAEGVVAGSQQSKPAAAQPTKKPEVKATPAPTKKPDVKKTPAPTATPTPTPKPTVEPEPSVEPEPTPEPSTEPEPTPEPTQEPETEESQEE